MAGCRDFQQAFEDFKVGELEGHSRPYSFRFQVADPDALCCSVEMAFQCDERLNGEWYQFPNWLDHETYHSLNFDSVIPAPPAPLNKYIESKLVKVKANGQVKDLFLKHVKKLVQMRCVVEPLSGIEHVVLSDDAAKYWRRRVADYKSEQALVARLAKVKLVVDLDSLRLPPPADGA